MKPIQRLTKDVVDRIAAGEVVQRPSAALKELLENSIDASSSRIAVTVQDGGLSLLQITDDGSGIAEKDLPLLCERFATSKLAHFDDLLAMSTFGFRGEALASISHVGRVTVTTKTRDSRYAVKVSFADGKMLSQPKPTAGNNGTVMTVEELFYTMQVRRKAMLQKANEEHSRIIDVIVRYAFAFPHVGFSLRRLGNSTGSGGGGGGSTLTPAALASAKIEFNFPEKSTTIANLTMYFGNTIAKALHPFSFDNRGGVGESTPASGGASSYPHPVHFNGYASALTLTHKRAIFILFINKRLVESNFLKKVIEQCYAPYLVNDNKPFVFLDVTVSPARADVNVHPTKHEVMLLDEDYIGGQLHAVLTGLIRGFGDSIVAGDVSKRGMGASSGGVSDSGASSGGTQQMLTGGTTSSGIDPRVLALKGPSSVSAFGNTNSKPANIASGVQVAPSTVTRLVPQRGDLLRLFKTAREREEQERRNGPAPFEDSGYYNNSSPTPLTTTGRGGKGSSSALPPFGLQPTPPHAPPTELRIDAVIDIADLVDDEDATPNNNTAMRESKTSTLGLKRVREGEGQEQDVSSGVGTSSFGEGALLSLMRGDDDGDGDEDDNDTANIALAFPAAKDSDDDEEQQAMLYGDGGNAKSSKGSGLLHRQYDDADKGQRLEMAMQDFNAYLASQRQQSSAREEGGAALNAKRLWAEEAEVATAPNVSSSLSLSLARASHQIPSAVKSRSSLSLPQQPALTVQLEFVAKKLALINSPACSSPESRHLFRSLTYVGILSHEHFLAQSGTSLLMIDWRPVVESICYQRLLTRWGRHKLVPFSPQSCPRVVDALQHHMKEKAAASPNAPLPSLVVMLTVLFDWREMLAEYFGIVIGFVDAQRRRDSSKRNASDDTTAAAAVKAEEEEEAKPPCLSDLRLLALPVLVGDRWPINQMAVPALLYKLATAVDYGSGEEACFEGVLRVVSRTLGRGFFFQCPSSVGGRLQQTKLVDAATKRAEASTAPASQPESALTPNRVASCSAPSPSSRSAVPPPPLLINSITSPRIIMSHPQCHEAFVDAVQGALLPSLASVTLYQPPRLFLADGTIKSVVTVEALYKVFERC